MRKGRMLLPAILIGLVGLAACNPAREHRERAAQAADAAPAARAPVPAPATPPPAASARPSCVDRELAARGLNPYGDPADTMYAGGTPLFDEKTGVAVDRVEYVLAHRPEIARACATAK
jgi:hypothetical protein